ncbi:MAG: choice-of-anchor D domain-containing protein [Verrucomicrobiota bacterium]
MKPATGKANNFQSVSTSNPLKIIACPFPSRGSILLLAMCRFASAAPEPSGKSPAPGDPKPAAGAVATPAYLKSSSPERYGNFGDSSAISGDTLVIGAPEEGAASGKPGAGAAYVFVRSGESWIQQARITAPDAGTYDFFGSSVAISGNTMVVGAPDQDGIDAEPYVDLAYGAAYVYVRSGTVWTLQATLRASNADQSDQFGYSVAISGDDIVIGAPYADGSGAREKPPFNATDFAGGAAYVFSRVNGNQWMQRANLKVAHDGSYSAIGLSVAISGNTLVSQGHVFVRTEIGWLFHASLKSPTAAYDDRFGAAVAISGETIVVGAPAEEFKEAEFSKATGAVHVFERNGFEWVETSLIKAFNAEQGDDFGNSVAISGDTIVVGAENEWGSGQGLNPVSDEEANYSGAAYAFTRQNRLWTLQSYLKASNTGADDYMGASVAIDGDTIVLGAPGESGSGKGFNPAVNESREGAGAVYLFAVSKLRQLVLSPEITVLGFKGDPIRNNATVNIGRQLVGKRSNSKELWIQNTGNIPLKLGGIKNAGKHSPEYRIEYYKYISEYHSSLAPGDKIQIELTIRPKAKGLRRTTLTIKSNDSDEPAFKIKLKGTGVKP